MADRIEIFAVTVAANTAKNAPQISNTLFNDGIVRHITITVPDGPSGFMGFNFLHMGGPVIPYTGNGFVIANNRVIEWDVSNMPTASGWQLQAYNTDIYPHTVYLEYLIDEIPVKQSTTIPLIPIG